MIFKHSTYSIDNPIRLGSTGDFEAYLWYITNKISNKKFTYTTRTSGTRISTKNLNEDEKIINDAWHFVKFYLDQGKETDKFIIAINSNSELGSFYTPKTIVQFITDILVEIKNSEDNTNQRWQSHKNQAHYPMVIDPACGEGIFLKQSIVQRLTKKEWIFGLDLDPEAVDKWETTNLLQEFNGDKKNLRSHFFHQNGLLPIQWSQHQKLYEKNINKNYLKNEQFDFVIGNPPYGGLGIYDEMRQLMETIKPSQNITEIKVTKLDLFGGEKIEITKPKKQSNKENLSKEKIKELINLSKELLNFSIWKDQKKNAKEKINQIIPFNGLKINYANLLEEKEIEKLKSFPIEVLFLERFIKLAKAPNKNKNGGIIAVIIPDGILSNSSMDYVRQFISQKTKVLGIFSLPRGTFKEAKTNAKTSILLLEKTDELNIVQDYSVFLASIPEIKEECFVTIKQYFTQFMTTQKSTQFVDDTNDLMIRTDKTLKDLNTEKPSGRWDPEYWHPKFDSLFRELQLKSTTSLLGVFLEEGTNGITYGQVGRREYDEKGDVYYIQVSNITTTGVDIYKKLAKIKKGSYNDPIRSRLKSGDLLIINGGVGSIGRSCILSDNLNQYNISQDIDRIRFKNGINKYYVCIFLNSYYGQIQIERMTKGVSGQVKIGFDHVKNLTIPLINNQIQNRIEERYIEIQKIHNQAINNIALGKENEYQEKMKQAQELLKDLVTKTEEVIRGERKNVD